MLCVPIPLLDKFLALPASEIKGKVIDTIWWEFVSGELKLKEADTAEEDDVIVENISHKL